MPTLTLVVIAVRTKQVHFRHCVGLQEQVSRRDGDTGARLLNVPPTHQTTKAITPATQETSEQTNPYIATY